MASVTFASDEKLKEEMSKFSWVNWSEVARENILNRDKLLELRDRLESREEKELLKWSVELGRKAKKGSFKRLLAEVSPEVRKRLLE